MNVQRPFKKNYRLDADKDHFRFTYLPVGQDNDERIVNLTLSLHLFPSIPRTNENSPLYNNSISNIALRSSGATRSEQGE